MPLGSSGFDFEGSARMNDVLPQGVSGDAKAARRHLLYSNLAVLRQMMSESRAMEAADPVGIIADGNNRYGMAIAASMYCIQDGLTKDQALAKVKEEIAGYNRQHKTPTYTMALPLSSAKALIGVTAPTARQNIEAFKAVRLPGQFLVVVIANDGNTYATIELPAAAGPVADGQHRTRVSLN
jgi:putative hemolysin